MPAEAEGRALSVLRSGSWVDGPQLEAFEEEFAAFTGCEHAIGVNSGTDALTIALQAHRVQGEVIVPSLTFAATAEAVIHAGCTPVFCDVGPDYTLTQETVNAVRTEDTAAVIAVHLFGQPAPQINGLLVIEDAAQAAGSDDICTNTAAFSFYPSKNLPGVGDGGIITTDDGQVAHGARSLRNHGRDPHGTHTRVGYTSRLDEIQASVLRTQLPHLRRWTERRRAIAHRYDEALGVEHDRRSSFHLYVIETDNRDELRRELADTGIETGVYYSPPLHEQPAFWQYAGTELPETERICERMLCLPMGPALTDEQVESVCQAITTKGAKCGYQAAGV